MAALVEPRRFFEYDLECFKILDHLKVLFGRAEGFDGDAGF